MRISADIRNAETWDEAAIAERGEHLAAVAVGLWQRPDDDIGGIAAGQARSGAVQPGRSPAGPPDPENPAAFASPLAIADEVGVGKELRRIIEVARELGLYPRPDRYSVMVSPPADRRVYLITVKPQWDEGGSFKIWKSPSAFAQWLPGVSLEAAQSALGASEEQGVLPAHDTDALLEIVRRLVPVAEPSAEVLEHRDHLVDIGVACAERIPTDVLRVIGLNAPVAPELALRFAAGALELDGTFLRSQLGKGDPWYFYVRHPAFPHVVAYVNVRATAIRIEYRLPQSHETYGLATSRSGDYPIVAKVSIEEHLEAALQLLGDALARAE